MRNAIQRYPGMNCCQEHVLPRKWNHTPQKVIGNTEETRALNAYVESPEQPVYQACRELIVTDATEPNPALYVESKSAGFEMKYTSIVCLSTKPERSR